MDHMIMSVSERVGKRLEGRRGGGEEGRRRRRRGEKERSLRMVTVEFSVAAVWSVYVMRLSAKWSPSAARCRGWCHPIT